MKNETAVAPVIGVIIGVILMVAITVILAAVIASFVFGMSGNISRTNSSIQDPNNVTGQVIDKYLMPDNSQFFVDVLSKGTVTTYRISDYPMYHHLVNGSWYEFNTRNYFSGAGYIESYTEVPRK